MRSAGKALNLGVMISGGLPVPGGFCVTTDAYRLVVADRLDDLMGKLADDHGRRWRHGCR